MLARYLGVPTVGLNERPSLSRMRVEFTFGSWHDKCVLQESGILDGERSEWRGLERLRRQPRITNGLLMADCGSDERPPLGRVQCRYELADQKQMCGERECVVGLGRAVAQSDVGGRALLTWFWIRNTSICSTVNLIQLSTEPPNSSVRGGKGGNEK